MVGNLKNNMKHKKIIVFAFLFICVLYSFSFYFSGYFFADHFYWQNMSQFKDLNAMHILSLWGIDIWADIFGRSLISSRVLAFILNSVCLCVPFYCINFKKSPDTYLYLCAAFILVGDGTDRCCNPDNFVPLLFSIIIVLLFKYCDCRSKTMILVSALILVVATGLCKMPTIIVMFIFSLLIYVESKQSPSKYIVPLIFIMCSIVGYLASLGGLLDTCNPLEFIHKDLNKYHEINPEQSHGMLALVVHYLKSIIRSSVSLAFIFFPFLLFKRYNRLFKESKLLIVLPFIVSLFLLTLVNNTIFYHLGIKEVVVFYTALLWLFIAYISYKENDGKYLLYLLVALTLFIPSAGSDSGFCRSAILACSMIPVGLTVFHKYKPKNTVFLYGLLVMSISSVFIQGKTLFSYDMVSKSHNLQCIFESRVTVEYTDELIDSSKHYYAKDHVVFMGPQQYTQLFYFVTESKPLYMPDFMIEKNNIQKINKGIDALNNDKNNVLIDANKSDVELFTSRGLQLIQTTELFNVYAF